jgi:hypothetical protein
MLAMIILFKSLILHSIYRNFRYLCYTYIVVEELTDKLSLSALLSTKQAQSSSDTHNSMHKHTQPNLLQNKFPSMWAVYHKKQLVFYAHVFSWGSLIK